MKYSKNTRKTRIVPQGEVIFAYFNHTYCLDNTVSYLLKPNPVTFTHIGEELLSENNHLYFRAGTFPVGAEGQIQLSSV